MIKIWKTREAIPARTEPIPVGPFLKYVDYWPGEIPPDYMKGYKIMIAEGQIKAHHVVYNRTTGSTLVEYWANQPQEWIRERIRKEAGK